MLLIAFVAFFILVFAWLMAPTGKIDAAPAPAAPALPLAEPLTA